MEKKIKKLCAICKERRTSRGGGCCVDCYNKIKTDVMKKRAAVNLIDVPNRIIDKSWNGKIYNQKIYIDGEPVQINQGEFVHFLNFSIAGTITSPRLPKLELIGDFPSRLLLEFGGETIEETIMTHSDWESRLFVWAKKIDEVWGLAKAYFSNFHVFIIGTKTATPKYQLIPKGEKEVFSEQRELARWAVKATFMRGALLGTALRSYDGPLTVFEDTVEEEIEEILIERKAAIYS